MHSEPSNLIKGVEYLSFEVHADERGSLAETFRASWFPNYRFVQANISRSGPGVLRGLHCHAKQFDLWTVPHGSVFVALVDARPTSPSRMVVETTTLSGPEAILIPPGVAHGYYTSEPSIVSYLVTEFYDGSDEFGIAWDDPDLAIPWPNPDPVVSDRDRANPRFIDFGDPLGGAS